MIEHRPVSLHFDEHPEDEMQHRAKAFYALMRKRRSVRAFDERPVPRALIEWAIRTAGTAPSGAHRQPWRFVAVDNPEIKRQIRAAAEAEEQAGDEEHVPAEWLEAAPWLVICFAERYHVDAGGARSKNDHVQESCGIACGLFVAALHNMGLATHAHRPSPMRFLNDILKRPEHEAPLLLFPVGYPAADAAVPDAERKPLDDIVQWNWPDV